MKYSVPVKSAFLHQTITLPGAFGGEKTLTQSRIPGIKLTYTDWGLLVEVKNVTAIVPHANVACCILEGDIELELEAPPPSASKKSKSAAPSAPQA